MPQSNSIGVLKRRGRDTGIACTQEGTYEDTVRRQP
jgi:hypothetical protein